MRRARKGGSPSLVGALCGGAAGAAVLVAINQAAHRLGATQLDLPRVLGLSFRAPGEAGVKLVGLAWYALSGGILVPVAYWFGFRGLRRAGVTRGLALGMVHYLASGALLALTDPDRPKRRRGAGRPMGGFLCHYGPLEWGANFLGHLGYGALMGAAASRD